MSEELRDSLNNAAGGLSVGMGVCKVMDPFTTFYFYDFPGPGSHRFVRSPTLEFHARIVTKSTINVEHAADKNCKLNQRLVSGGS